MAKKKIIREGDNVAKWFAIISGSFESVAQKTGLSTLDIIIRLRSDLINENTEGYERQLDDIKIKGLTESGKKELVKYLDRIIKKESPKKGRESSIDPEVEKRKKESAKRRADEKAKKAEEERARRQAEEDKKRQEKIENEWKRIYTEVLNSIEENISYEEFADNTPIIRSIWRLARERFLETKKASTVYGQEILHRLDDEIYFQDVKYFTRDFSFLAEDSFIAMSYGGLRGRKFSDTATVDRFERLRKVISTERTESAGIRKALANPETDAATIRILKARQEAIKAEMERKCLDYEI